MSATCRSCGARVLWAITEHGNRMPVDPAPSPNGNIRLTDGPDPVAIVHSRSHDAANAEQLHTSHFSTCRYADRHRRRVQQAREARP